MSFGDEVLENQSPGGSSIPSVVIALNHLPKKERAEIVAYLDALPPGIQFAAVAKAIVKRAAKHGYSGRLNGGQIRRFVEGSRNGLLP